MMQKELEQSNRTPFGGALAVRTFFDTDDLPAPRRFALWRELASSLFIPVAVQSRDHDAFRYRSVRTTLDGIPIGSSTARDLQVRRAAHHIDDPDACPLSIYVPLNGELNLSQAGRERCVRPGELSFVDGGRPYDQGVPGDLDFVWLHVPKDRLSSRFGRVEALAGLTLESHDPRNPYTRLAVDFIRSVAGMADRLDGENARRIADQVLDLVAMAVEHDIGMAPTDRDTRRAATLHYARTFMERNLADSELSLEKVAAALKVSPRYLSGLFSDAETPYRTWLRERRLEQCARALATPQFAHRSLTDIAHSWGFADSAHFSRCFKQRYGLSLGDYRAASKNATLLSSDEDDPLDDG
jgi:AraC-like DNA-binding protein